MCCVAYVSDKVQILFCLCVIFIATEAPYKHTLWKGTDIFLKNHAILLKKYDARPAAECGT